jgi:hypothetical protein
MATITCVPINWYCNDNGTSMPSTLVGNGNGTYCWCYSNTTWIFDYDLSTYCHRNCNKRCEALLHS